MRRGLSTLGALLVASGATVANYLVFHDRVAGDPPVAVGIVSTGIVLQVLSVIAILNLSIQARRLRGPLIAFAFMAVAIGTSLVEQGALFGGDFGKHRVLRTFPGAS